MKVAFEVPEAFGEVEPLAGNQTAGEALANRLGDRLNALSQSEFSDLSSAIEIMSSLYHASGTFYAANCYAEIEGEQSIAMLNMAISSVAFRDARLAADGMAASIGRRNPSGGNHVQILEMPCGPGVLEISRFPGLRIPEHVSESGEELSIELGQLQAHIPVPPSEGGWGSNLVTVTCTTPSLRHWDAYCEMTANLLRSISFVHGFERDM